MSPIIILYMLLCACFLVCEVGLHPYEGFWGMKKHFYLQLESVVALSPSLEKGDVAVQASAEMLNSYKGDLQ